MKANVDPIKKGDLVLFNDDFVYTEGELGIVVRMATDRNAYNRPVLLAEVLWQDGSVDWQLIEDLVVAGDA